MESTSVGAGGGGGGDSDPQPPQFVPGEDDNRPLTYAEKRRLSLGINMLPGPELGRIIHIIQSAQPTSEDEDNNECIIDFDSMKPSTLRALDQFVRSKLPALYEQQLDDL